MTCTEMIRCKKCDNLIITEDGKWICKETGTEIWNIDNDSCPLEEDY